MVRSDSFFVIYEYLKSALARTFSVSNKFGSTFDYEMEEYFQINFVLDHCQIQTDLLFEGRSHEVMEVDFWWVILKEKSMTALVDILIYIKMRIKYSHDFDRT